LIRRALIALGIVVAALALAVAGVFVALNSGAGRQFAEQKLNQLIGPNLQITGLAGHFPVDIKLAAFSLTDANGVWLSGTGLDLRWQPLDLLRRRLEVTSLTAATLSIARPPLPGKAAPPTSSSPASSSFQADIGQLSINQLNLGAALTGEAAQFRVTGALHLGDLTHGSLSLDAATLDGSATYHAQAAFTPQTSTLNLHVQEPPNGLLGRLAGLQVHAPLKLDLTLAGPRDDSALAFTLLAAGAELDGTGTLGLDPEHPHADLQLSTPALAPYAALAGENVQGHAGLHLIATQSGGQTSLALTSTVALTTAPGPLAKLVGENGTLALNAVVRGQTLTVSRFAATGAGFSLSAAGSAGADSMTLTTTARLNQVADISPGLSGAVQLSGTVIGGFQDFAVDALLTGDVAAPEIPSGPFSIAVKAQHLPALPVGTLTGSGALENAPLRLDAAFARHADGSFAVKINNAMWRSLSAKAALALAPGATLPTGTAQFAATRLQDFAAFSPLPLRGAASGDFSYSDGQGFKLGLTAQNLVVDPQIGAINATVNAAGPPGAVTTRVQADVASLLGQPAHLALTGVLDVTQKSAALSAFTATWHGLDAALQGPASLDAATGLAVHHLSLGVNGGRIGVDGTFSPTLKANIVVDRLPARLAGLFVPGLAASGTLSATASLSGLATAPAGRFTVDASAIRFLTGPAASVPQADLTASGTANGGTAVLNLNLTAGPNLSLAASGQVPEQPGGALNLHLTGRTDLRLADPLLAAQGTVARGVIATDVTLTGSAAAPRATGTVTLSGGSLQNLASGLDLTAIAATVTAAGQLLTLQSFTATAGTGSVGASGTLDLGTPGLPVTLALTAHNATPVSSDLMTETLDGNLTLTGAVQKRLTLAGQITIDQANINIPKSLPPAVANLPIVYAGQPPPPPSPPPPAIGLDLIVRADNKIFIRGDGLFAEFAGRVHVTGTADNALPEGGFKLVRGDFSLAGKSLQFTKGSVEFTGDGFTPTLDLEATAATSTNGTATLIIGGTAARPAITLTSSPPLPSDEILAQLLFAESANDLTPFQAASLAAALAQLSGVGGGNPLDSVRNALGLDQLSVSGNGSGPPSLQAGRYVAPGVYVGATQATNGQGTQATVDINLARGLKLQTQTGTSTATSGQSSSVGLTYQFDY
jgi:translocation and assembly module TamB